MENFTPVTALIGGVCIGFGSLLLMMGLGRIAGISGITNALMFQTGDKGWRLAFVLGLLAGPLLAAVVLTDFSYSTPELDLITLLAGLLVGLGTAWGSGCTSGHGVCGIGRFSVRSIIATGTFMLAGVLVASFFR